MGILTFLLLVLCVATGFVFKNNYHVAIIKYFQRREKIKKRKSKNPVYRKTFEAEFRQYLKDTNKEKPYQAGFVCAGLFVLALVFLVINTWIKPAGGLTKALDWCAMAGTAAFAINGFLCSLEATVVADEKGFAKVDEERKKNQQLLKPPPAATGSSTPATQSASGSTSPAAPPTPRRPSMSAMSGNTTT